MLRLVVVVAVGFLRVLSGLLVWLGVKVVCVWLRVHLIFFLTS